MHIFVNDKTQRYEYYTQKSKDGSQVMPFFNG